MKNDTISIRIHTERKQTLQKQAEQKGMSLSSYIIGLLETDSELPCEKSQRKIQLIEIYNAIKHGNTCYALKLLERQLNENGPEKEE